MQAQVTSRCTDDSTDPPKPEFFPHKDPNECFKYVSCWAGREYVVTCPNQLFHDKCNPDRCDTRENIEDNCACSSCPAGKTGVIPSPRENQCSEFILCINGQDNVRRCNPGQSFDSRPEVLECRDIKDVNCTINSCAMTSQHLAAFAPNYKNCGQYFVCSEGKVVSTIDCPAGFMFDMNGFQSVGAISFPGSCVRVPEPPAENPIECFDGFNFPVPAPPPTPPTPPTTTPTTTTVKKPTP